jgi:hypothetical protein
MQGSIRFFAGLLLTLGAVGGIENSVTNTELMTSVAVAIGGLVLTAFGMVAMRRSK